ncbi:hypothetical protein N657DRAFT_638487 [Parathielavia appendiculata]|uniref:Uncharacterized protein n=1 Tax=Parathielavia appendiculata TaxID=2587402 RepID=A0AAN6U7W3_9PEZI|nr:hypothetical protein N657DRAFT_638487 [Parathielavia appendiculata]
MANFEPRCRLPALVLAAVGLIMNQGMIGDAAARKAFEGGNMAYEIVYADFVWWFPEATRDETVQTYVLALRLIWQISIAFSSVNYLIAILEKQVPLRTELNTEFGLEKVKYGSEGGRMDAERRRE